MKLRKRRSSTASTVRTDEAADAPVATAQGTPGESRASSTSLVPAREAGPNEATLLQEYVHGITELALMPAAGAKTEEAQLEIIRQAGTLRNEIARQLSGADIVNVMLADACATAFYESRRYSMMLTAVCSGEQTSKNLAAIDKLDRAATRATKRFLAAMEALRTDGAGPVKVTVGRIDRVGNICGGDQTLMRNGEDDDGGLP